MLSSAILYSDTVLRNNVNTFISVEHEAQGSCVLFDHLPGNIKLDLWATAI